MHWIEEVEIVDSVDELRSSSSTRGIQLPNFEVFDAKIASALNRIIHIIPNSKERSVWRNKRPRSRIVSFRCRQIAYLIYEQFRVTGTDNSVENTPTCSPLFFEMKIFRNSIRNGTESLLTKMKKHI